MFGRWFPEPNHLTPLKMLRCHKMIRFRRRAGFRSGHRLAAMDSLLHCVWVQFGDVARPELPEERKNDTNKANKERGLKKHVGQQTYMKLAIAGIWHSSKWINLEKRRAFKLRELVVTCSYASLGQKAELRIEWVRRVIYCESLAC